MPLSKDELEMLVPKQAGCLRDDRLPGLSKMDLRSHRSDLAPSAAI